MSIKIRNNYDINIIFNKNPCRLLTKMFRKFESWCNSFFDVLRFKLKNKRYRNQSIDTKHKLPYISMAIDYILYIPYKVLKYVNALPYLVP